MGNMGPVPEPRSSSRHHKSSYSAAFSAVPVPGTYDGGSVKRTPTPMSSPRTSHFPAELGGRSPTPNPSQQHSYQTAQTVPRSPDGVTGHRMSMSMAMSQRPPSSVHPQHAPRPSSHADPRYSDPRYSSNGRGY
ncbi:hypothetical protein K438DRAFT_1109635 [Mycena galopus ATCC 62051]|nr:hypothetical protein K438DRAFT_1109635 [Mycena galopus ATCC 62051]